MTSEQQSQHTRLKREQIQHEHMSCAMQVKTQGPHMGLYCADHGTWIKWISPKQVKLIQDLL